MHHVCRSKNYEFFGLPWQSIFSLIVSRSAPNTFRSRYVHQCVFHRVNVPLDMFEFEMRSMQLVSNWINVQVNFLSVPLVVHEETFSGVPKESHDAPSNQHPIAMLTDITPTTSASSDPSITKVLNFFA